MNLTLKGESRERLHGLMPLLFSAPLYPSFHSVSLQACESESVSHSVTLALCNHKGYIAHQAPLSRGLHMQEYGSGLPFPFQGIFLSQGSLPGLLHCRQVLNHPSQFIYHLIPLQHWTGYLGRKMNKVQSLYSRAEYC